MLQRRIAVLNEDMGMVIEKNSYAGRAITTLVSRLRRSGKLEHDIRLHQERGVYNAYMKLPAAKAKELKEIPAHALDDERSASPSTPLTPGATGWRDRKSEGAACGPVIRGVTGGRYGIPGGRGERRPTRPTSTSKIREEHGAAQCT